MLCTIAGAITRLFGSNWDMSLESILAPGMREFALRTGGESLQRFARLEQVTTTHHAQAGAELFLGRLLTVGFL